ncbi:MAG: hypothetical protein SFX73_28240 [Kofleriaceae bacterium]|nr:hypothetical protein [Kofleriaceae bacterium]
MRFLVPLVGVVAACAALCMSRARYYRAQKPTPAGNPRPRSPRALSDDERAEVLAVLDSDEFMDKAPAQVFAKLLEDGRYLCSLRTMYRILADADQVRERRAQRQHPAYTKPELVATAPNQVWTWDITKPERALPCERSPRIARGLEARRGRSSMRRSHADDGAILARQGSSAES